MQVGANSVNVNRSSRTLWEELGQIKSAYGQLVFLAGLLDVDTGRYRHYGLAIEATDRELNLILQRAHESIFQAWIDLSLEVKMREVELYIEGLPGVDRVELVDAWLRLTPYKNLVPASIQGPERQKHVSDFEAILGLLRNVYGVAGPDANA